MLKASRLPRRKDSGGAGTETSTVPFPYQKAKGGSLPRIWVAPRSKHALVPNLGTGVSFLRRAFPVRGSLWRAFCRGGAEPRPYRVPRKKATPIRISAAPSIDSNRSTATSCKPDTSVSGGAYQDAREVTSEWNDA